jgi:predicted ArsR family transcriptional regulator
MQQTRKLILDYLKEHGQATVDELAGVLDLTSVTVRHHLDILRGEGLVSEPLVRHRTTPGRPQFAYALTDKASQHFPKNYRELAATLLEEVKAFAPPQGINVIFEGVANRLSAAAPRPEPGEPLPKRLDRAVAFLNSQGYVASWEREADGYLLHTCNCPYETLAEKNQELCQMDLKFVGNLVGGEVKRVSRVIDGASSCAYRLREPEAAAVGLLS